MQETSEELILMIIDKHQRNTQMARHRPVS